MPQPADCKQTILWLSEDSRAPGGWADVHTLAASALLQPCWNLLAE